MDELKITSKFMRNVVSKIVSKMLYKKLGYKIDIKFEDINILSNEGKMNIRINANAEIDSAEFKKFLKFVDEDGVL